MATGTAGSTFTSELNRLAFNAGGTYPPISEYLTATAAANSYAGIGADQTPFALIGALNKAVDPNRQPNEYKALNAICNEIAGTTGLSATDALRSMDL
jgi:hypothetical protein